jgi:hypothetical protein
MCYFSLKATINRFSAIPVGWLSERQGASLYKFAQ